VTVAAAIGYGLGLEVFSFVVKVVAEQIEEGESLAAEETEILAPNSTLQRAFPRQTD
jgi:hypothetical protein